MTNPAKRISYVLEKATEQQNSFSKQEFYFKIFNTKSTWEVLSILKLLQDDLEVCQQILKNNKSPLIKKSLNKVIDLMSPSCLTSKTTIDDATLMCFVMLDEQNVSLEPHLNEIEKNYLLKEIKLLRLEVTSLIQLQILKDLEQSIFIYQYTGFKILKNSAQVAIGKCYDYGLHKKPYWEPLRNILSKMLVLDSYS